MVVYYKAEIVGSCRVFVSATRKEYLPSKFYPKQLENGCGRWCVSKQFDYESDEDLLALRAPFFCSLSRIVLEDPDIVLRESFYNLKFKPGTNEIQDMEYGYRTIVNPFLDTKPELEEFTCTIKNISEERVKKVLEFVVGCHEYGNFSILKM